MPMYHNLTKTMQITLKSWNQKKSLGYCWHPLVCYCSINACAMFIFVIVCLLCEKVLTVFACVKNKQSITSNSCLFLFYKYLMISPTEDDSVLYFGFISVTVTEDNLNFVHVEDLVEKISTLSIS